MGAAGGGRGQLVAGETVLDVACGTGVLAREAARRVGPNGAVIGLDRNDGMLAVARRSAPISLGGAVSPKHSPSLAGLSTP